MIIETALKTIDLSNNSREERIEALNALFRELYEKQEIIQKVIIDGVNYVDNYNLLLTDSTMSIQHVKIESVHEVILVRDISEDLRAYLPKLIRACDSISENFYGEMNEESWGQFSQLTEGIQWVAQSAHLVLGYALKSGDSVLHAKLTRFNEELEGQLGELESMIQGLDYTAVGDLIKYELPETFKPLLELLDTEVTA